MRRYIYVLFALFLIVTSSAWGLGTQGKKSTFTGTTAIQNQFDGNSLTSGTLFKLSSTGTLTGTMLDITSNTMTSGNLLKLVLDADAATGKFINCLGGTDHATAKFTVDYTGAGAFASTLSAGATTVASGVCTAGMTFGGGYGSTGATISTVGVGQFNGALTVDGATTLTGATTQTGALTCSSTLSVAGAATIPIRATAVITCAAGTTALDATYYGKTCFITGAAAQTITLPANGATTGANIEFIVIGADTSIPTFAAATADSLITVNDQAADSVTFGTGHRIGACVRFISDGTNWNAVNVGSTTMTVAT